MRGIKVFNLTALFQSYKQDSQHKCLTPTSWLRQSSTASLIVKEISALNPTFVLDFTIDSHGRVRYKNLNESKVVESKRGTGGGTWCTEKIYLAAKNYLEQENLEKVFKQKVAEEASLKTIEQILGVKLIRQYRCLNYFIDGYDLVNNIAYEVDEAYHTSNNRADTQRELEITKVLNCTFVRIKVY